MKDTVVIEKERFEPRRAQRIAEDAEDNLRESLRPSAASAVQNVLSFVARMRSESNFP
jgi:hypothetical protein